jgi:hypothetical protein
LACLNQVLIRRHLDLPVAVITDSATADHTDFSSFDQVIIDDSPGSNSRRFELTGQSIKTSWLNGSRPQAYDLSPFDQTLLIDADYMIFSDRLNLLFDTDLEFGVFARSHDITGQNVFRDCARVAAYSLPMSWATVIYFTRNTFAQSVFDMMRRVQDHYDYYSLLYRFPMRPYRNDYALSVALNTLSGYGHSSRYHIPWSCATLTTQAEIIDYDASRGLKYRYTRRDGNRSYPCVARVNHTDLHVMDKRSILNFYDEITAEE